MLSSRLRLLRKIGAISIAVIVGVAFSAVAIVYAVSAWQLSKHHKVAEPALRVTATASMVVEGARLAHVNGCFGCHGDDMTGHVFVDNLFVGRLSGPNLTRIIPHYSNQQIADLIRSGVRPNGAGIVFMPSHVLVKLADADIAAIIAFLRTLEPRPDTAKDSNLGPLLRALIVAGALPLEPNKVDSNQIGPPARPANGEALGQYLAKTTCAMCHGDDLYGEKQMKSPNLYEMVPAYSLDQFHTLMSTGLAPGGRKLGLMTEMSGGLKFLRDDEVAALHAYFSAGDPAKRP
jgi:cytochrome c553